MLSNHLVFVSVAKTSKGLGFMSGKIGQKRVNVMLSRAKDELVVVGHLSHVLSFDPDRVCHRI
jgi:superfamily I DNA and/or RNA helicase